jgi:hypothetical protein
MGEDYSPQPVWDEYQWERFLQEQEHRTDQYIRLVEMYRDHPNRDEIIAREMGWGHLDAEEERAWAEEVDALFSDIFHDQVDSDEAEGEGEEWGESGEFDFVEHPLYKCAVAVGMEVDDTIAKQLRGKAEPPGATDLSSAVTVVAAKLAGALNDDEDDANELGMSIAYLKRALKAVHSALDAVLHLLETGFFSRKAADRLTVRLFDVRDAIIVTMGEYRHEFWRRHGRS